MEYKVLIVEDDPMVLLINQRYVNKVAGFTVVADAPTIAQAKATLTENDIDLVLIDIHLKNESGIDLLKWIRSENLKVDCIIISAVNQIQTVEIASRFGAIDYILKPFKFERFRQSLIQFKKKAALLNDPADFKQEDLDKLYWTYPSNQSLEDFPLEKGISHNTLRTILAAIHQLNAPFSVEELSDKTGISHVTVRKYIQYLYDKETLSSNTVYGDIGRPITIYEMMR